jgi:hypothetical protein
MDAGRLSQGQMIAAVSAVLLVISLFLAWIGISVDAPAGIPGVEVIEDSSSATGWESQNTLDLYLLIVAGFALAPAAMRMMGSEDSLPFTPAAATFLLASIGTLLTLYVMIDVPDGADRKIGLFLALIAVAGVAVGSYLSVQDEAAAERY